MAAGSDDEEATTGEGSATGRDGPATGRDSPEEGAVKDEGLAAATVATLAVQVRASPGTFL